MPGHTKKERKKKDITITGVEKTLRRREAKEAGGGGAEQTAAVEAAEEKARNIPQFRKLKAGDPIPGEGIDPGTAQQGTFLGTREELLAQAQGTPGVITQQEFKQTVSEQTIQELEQVQDPQEQSILSKLLFGPPESELKQGTVPLGLGVLKAAGATIQAGRTGQVAAFNRGIASGLTASTARITAAKIAATPVSFYTKVGLSLGAAGLAVTAIGSFPFAGFIKEESLQNLGFATSSAIRNNDIKGLESSIKLTEEILKITTTEKILAAIPFANTLAQLKDFFASARIKLEIDKRKLEELKSERGI